MPARRCVILAPLLTQEDAAALALSEDDLILCADGGYDAAARCGIRPHLVIGDFDSMPEDRLPENVRRVRLPVHKDDTDTAVCLREGRRQGCKRFVLAGCVGGRLGHTLSNLQCLYDCALLGEKAEMIGAGNRARILLPGTYALEVPEGDFLSLLAWTPEVKGVCLTGCEWNLENAVLTSRCPLGVSNRPLGSVRLSFTEGALAVIFEHDVRRTSVI